MNVRYLLPLAAALLVTPGHAQNSIRRTVSSPYAQWKRGLPASDTFFPIAVWLQSPSNAAAYKAAGINLYVALWQGPTKQQLSQLTSAGMPVIVDQSPRALEFIDDPIIVGWMHGDEPDNAQEVVDPITGKKGYGPCIPPAKIVTDYQKMRAADPSRPVLLNLGQGVANNSWIGRGSGAKLDDYRTYVQGADICSFDVYPVAENLQPGNGDNLSYVTLGIDRLMGWAGPAKPVWNCIECTQIGGDHKATPEQVRAEVWMALTHGSRGLIYFVHQFKPKFNEHALLDDPEMLRTVTATNKQIKELAPILNTPTLSARAESTSSSVQTPIDHMVKHYKGATYLFAVATRSKGTTGSFTVRGAPKRAAVEVIGEERKLTMTDGRFQDSFKPYEVHIYKVAGVRY